MSYLVTVPSVQLEAETEPIQNLQAFVPIESLFDDADSIQPLQALHDESSDDLWYDDDFIFAVFV